MQQELKYIYQVYLDGSFSKAAEHLYLTQPALSIAIQKIETAIGMPLFDRSRRPLQLTAAGQIYIDTIKKIQNLELDLEQQIDDVKDLKTGTLRIGGSHYLNSYILPRILTGFGREYPGIRLDLVEDSSDHLADMLSDQTIDLTFSCNSQFMRDFERYPAFYDHILLAVPKSAAIHRQPDDGQLAAAQLSAEDILKGRHLSDACPTVALSLFQDQDFILLSKGNNLYDRSIRLFREAGITPRIKMTLSQLVTAYHLAESGFAATFISDRLILSPDSSLVFYKPDSAQINRLFYILLPRRHYTSHAAKMFIQYFLVHLEPENVPGHKNAEPQSV